MKNPKKGKAPKSKYQERVAKRNSFFQPVEEKVWHASGAIVYEIKDDGTVLMVGLICEAQSGWSPWKFPIESGLDREKTAIEILMGGLQQELLEDGQEEVSQFEVEDEIFTRQKPDDRGGVHQQHFFLVKLVRGELRKIAMQDGPDILSPPEWVEARELYARMLERGVWVHKKALRKALAHLSVRYPEVALRYAGFLKEEDERERAYRERRNF